MKIFWIFYIYFKNVTFITIFIRIFYEFWYIIFFNLKFPTGRFCDTSHPYKLLASKYFKYDDSLFLSYSSYIYCFLWNICMLLDTFFLEFLLQTSLAYHCELIALILLLSFLSKLVVLVQGQIKKEQDQSYVFLCIYL